MGNTLRSIKNEFKIENFSLNFEKNSEFLQKDPEEVLEYFHSAIWPCCNRFVYLVYRIFIAVYYTIWFVESIVRNAEFRAQNWTMTNKKKTNTLHLHPWPFYMTSWSLTLLFIHLWISAFIVLYFYSINQKSRLYALFSYLFGPYSCSKISQANLNKQTTSPSRCRSTSTDVNFLIRLFNIIFCRGDRNLQATTSGQAATSNNDHIVNVHLSPNFNRNECNCEKSSPDECESLQTSKYSKETNTVLLDAISKLESNIQEVDERNETTVQVNQVDSAAVTAAIRVKETYCDNKSQCYLPSSSISDIVSWRLWIKSHVPVVILVLIKISWLLYNQIVISAIVVSIGYFTYIYITDMETEPTWLTEIGNLHRHGFNSIVAIIDICLLAYPVRILHFIYTAIYGWLYAIVTFIYWSQNPEKNIVYQEIDYNKPLAIFGYYILLTMLTFIMQLFHYFAYRLKLFIRYEYLLVKENCFQ